MPNPPKRHAENNNNQFSTRVGPEQQVQPNVAHNFFRKKCVMDVRGNSSQRRPICEFASDSIGNLFIWLLQSAFVLEKEPEQHCQLQAEYYLSVVDRPCCAVHHMSGAQLVRVHEAKECGLEWGSR